MQTSIFCGKNTLLLEAENSGCKFRPLVMSGLVHKSKWLILWTKLKAIFMNIQEPHISFSFPFQFQHRKLGHIPLNYPFPLSWQDKINPKKKKKNLLLILWSWVGMPFPILVFFLCFLLEMWTLTWTRLPTTCFIASISLI